MAAVCASTSQLAKFQATSHLCLPTHQRNAGITAVHHGIWSLTQIQRPNSIHQCLCLLTYLPSPNLFSQFLYPALLSSFICLQVSTIDFHFVFHCVYLIIVLFEKIIPVNFPMSFIKTKCDFISSITNTSYREGEGRLKHDSATLIYTQGLHK